MQDWTKVLKSVILLNKMLFRRSAPIHSDGSLNLTQEKVLLAVYDNPMSSQKEIIRYMDKDKGSVSKVIQNLVELGFVERHPFAQDRRQVRLELSVTGKAEILRIKDNFSRHVNKTISELDKDKQEALYIHLDALLDIALEIEAKQGNKEL
ncbi:MarR family winged helix-turn-helix transcriptional regulator [Vibrio sp. JC009]|uniref:MarR family winged helix-turn-helix transcriptional regulator n=1 Tax=Vibrio sp. JC009 TaxID=2912314 RepID=UPI0023AFC118|nr:MarR family transcriptional regulator [Vibrio sp. JC009]WED24657.1 MarR family winged helix-turn-helix transcriptional regulator [Vibrio sp. JC009]